VTQNASCRDYAAGPDVLNAVVHGGSYASGIVLVIHPSALPSGAGLQLFVTPDTEDLTMELSLVHTSRQCTGLAGGLLSPVLRDRELPDPPADSSNIR